MITDWEDLKYWETGEWQVVEERLDDLKVAGIGICPQRENLFQALYECPFQNCKAAIFGQDPYPDPQYATGLAFSIPKAAKTWPPTLKTIFQEYQSDLHYPSPISGDLTDWAREGVLLWNVVPSCQTGRSLSHDWYEWTILTEEIIYELSTKGVVFVFLGGRARRLANRVVGNNNRVIEAGHPSALARLNPNAKAPFLGSRIFTRINAALTETGHDPIDWKLQHEKLQAEAKGQTRKS